MLQIETFKPLTDWQPPKSEDIPLNWRIVKWTHNGATYKSQTGIVVKCEKRYQDGQTWIYLSVSNGKKCPSWIEFNHVKNLFLGEDL